jgi:hypothetical protein
MRLLTRSTILLAALLCANITSADVTETTPYDYDKPPKAGREGGTYAFQLGGGVGPDCVPAVIGTMKVLPNQARTGGTVCTKFNIEAHGTGPFCAFAPAVEGVLAVSTGSYALNRDGTACVNLMFVEPALLAGTVTTFHAYFDPKGRTMLISGQDIAYPCPGIVPNGPPFGGGTAFKIGKHGDDPPGSGTLACP